MRTQSHVCESSFARSYIDPGNPGATATFDNTIFTLRDRVCWMHIKRYEWHCGDHMNQPPFLGKTVWALLYNSFICQDGIPSWPIRLKVQSGDEIGGSKEHCNTENNTRFQYIPLVLSVVYLSNQTFPCEMISRQECSDGFPQEGQLIHETNQTSVQAGAC